MSCQRSLGSEPNPGVGNLETRPITEEEPLEDACAYEHMLFGDWQPGQLENLAG